MTSEQREKITSVINKIHEVKNLNECNEVDGWLDKIENILQPCHGTPCTMPAKWCDNHSRFMKR